jgi:hypothetical protein
MDIEVKGLSFQDPKYTSGQCHICSITAHVFIPDGTPIKKFSLDEVDIAFRGSRGGLHGKLGLPVKKARELGMALVACAEEYEQKMEVAVGQD